MNNKSQGKHARSYIFFGTLVWVNRVTNPTPQRKFMKTPMVTPVILTSFSHLKKRLKNNSCHLTTPESHEIHSDHSAEASNSSLANSATPFAPGKGLLKLP